MNRRGAGASLLATLVILSGCAPTPQVSEGTAEVVSPSAQQPAGSASPPEPTAAATAPGPVQAPVTDATVRFARELPNPLSGSVFMASGGNRIWVASEMIGRAPSASGTTVSAAAGWLMNQDLGGAKAERTIAFASAPRGLAVAGDQAWVSLAGSIVRVDAADNKVAATAKVAGAGPIAADATSAWAALPGDTTSALVHINPSGQVLARIGVAGTITDLVIASPHDMWVSARLSGAAEPMSSILMLFDPADGRLIASAPVAESVVGLVADAGSNGQAIAVLPAAEPSRITLLSLGVLGVGVRSPALDALPGDVAFAGGAAWLTRPDGVVIDVDRQTGSELGLAIRLPAAELSSALIFRTLVAGSVNVATALVLVTDTRIVVLEANRGPGVGLRPFRARDDPRPRR